MRSTLALSAIAAIIASTASVHALESSMTVRSSPSPGELWNKIGDFCVMTAWDPTPIISFEGLDAAKARIDHVK